MKRIFLAFVIWVLASTCVYAAATPVPNAQTVAANPVLAALQKLGAKFFYLGNQSGLDGWFIIKDGQVQIAYATPDNRGAVIGALFGANGENITASEVSALVHTNKEVSELIMAGQKDQSEAAKGSTVSAGTSPADSAAPVSVKLSPGDRLIQDLTAASNVVLGRPSAPELLMVMDPHCPHCQATWKVLRDSVKTGKLHIKMVPIGTKDDDSERAAAILLGVSDPLASWDAYVAGDKSQLAGTPLPAALNAVRANHALAEKWSIESTPYLVYRAKDGKVKVLVGEPNKVSVVLTDMGI